MGIGNDYESYVETISPSVSLPMRMAKAFVTGGIICLIGQIVTNVSKLYLGLGTEESGCVCSLSLILLSVILTSFSLYQRITSYGGAGALVPITGFANSVAAPAIEYKAEGQVFGIGCKIFTIAGPVILYGTVVSFVLGVLYYLAIHWSGWFL